MGRPTCRSHRGGLGGHSTSLSLSLKPKIMLAVMAAGRRTASMWELKERLTMRRSQAGVQMGLLINRSAVLW